MAEPGVLITLISGTGSLGSISSTTRIGEIGGDDIMNGILSRLESNGALPLFTGLIGGVVSHEKSLRRRDEVDMIS